MVPPTLLGRVFIFLKPLNQLLSRLPGIACHQLSGSARNPVKGMSHECHVPAVSPHSPSHSSILLFSSWPKSLISRFSEDELLYSEVPTPERILVWQHTSVVLPAEPVLWAPLLKLPASQASEHKMNHTIGFPGSLDRYSRTFGFHRRMGQFLSSYFPHA